MIVCSGVGRLTNAPGSYREKKSPFYQSKKKINVMIFKHRNKIIHISKCTMKIFALNIEQKNNIYFEA